MPIFYFYKDYYFSDRLSMNFCCKLAKKKPQFHIGILSNLYNRLNIRPIIFEGSLVTSLLKYSIFGIYFGCGYQEGSSTAYFTA